MKQKLGLMICLALSFVLAQKEKLPQTNSFYRNETFGFTLRNPKTKEPSPGKITYNVATFWAPINKNIPPYLVINCRKTHRLDFPGFVRETRKSLEQGGFVMEKSKKATIAGFPALDVKGKIPHLNLMFTGGVIFKENFIFVALGIADSSDFKEYSPFFRESIATLKFKIPSDKEKESQNSNLYCNKTYGFSIIPPNFPIPSEKKGERLCFLYSQVNPYSEARIDIRVIHDIDSQEKYLKRFRDQILKVPAKLLSENEVSIGSLHSYEYLYQANISKAKLKMKSVVIFNEQQAFIFTAVASTRYYETYKDILDDSLASIQFLK